MKRKSLILAMNIFVLLLGIILIWGPYWYAGIVLCLATLVNLWSLQKLPETNLSPQKEKSEIEVRLRSLALKRILCLIPLIFTLLLTLIGALILIVEPYSPGQVAFFLIALALTVALFYARRHFLLRETALRHASTLTHLQAPQAVLEGIARQEILSDSIGQTEKSWWQTYERQHAEEIAALKRETEDVLARLHGIRLNRVLPNLYPHLPRSIQTETAMHYLGKTAMEGADRIRAYLAHSGEIGNPDIMLPNAPRPLPPALRKINRILFTAYEPGPIRLLVASLLYATLVPMVYACISTSVAPMTDLFVPSQTWQIACLIAIPILTLLVTAALFWRETLGDTKAFLKVDNQYYSPLGKVGLGLTFSVFLCSSILYGGGEFWTEQTAKDQSRAFVVTKVMETRHRIGRVASTDAYCVTSFGFADLIFRKNEYCLKKEHYEDLPAAPQPTILYMNIRESALGFVVRGYYR